MEIKKFEQLTNSIKKKLGKENTSLIADDLGILITDNANVNKELEEKNNEINTLKQDKENLITVNGNLLQQIPMEEDEEEKTDKKEETKKFDYYSAFDERGNFK